MIKLTLRNLSIEQTVDRITTEIVHSGIPIGLYLTHNRLNC